MGDKSKIEFCDATVNPVIGCTKTDSPGCDGCWAERLHEQRHKAYREGKRVPHQYAHPFSKIKLLPERIDQALRWKKPKRIFWCSTSDLFHPAVPESFIGRCRWAMAATPQHTHIVITKRAMRLLESSRGLAHYPNGDRAQRPRIGWPPNVIVMVTVTNQMEADRDIPLLLQVEAKWRGVSVEPMLSEVNLIQYLDPDECDHARRSCEQIGCTGMTRLDWVIIGEESGPRRRHAPKGAVDSLAADVKAAGLPLFVKQANINGKLVKMPFINGRQWAEFPEGK